MITENWWVIAVLKLKIFGYQNEIDKEIEINIELNQSDARNSKKSIFITKFSFHKFSCYV